MVSLFTDFASEMLYPVMPMYLQHIGFSILLIGVLEGVAEAVAGLSKGYFGKLSDATGKRLPFVKLGYLMSAVSKPMMALFIYPLWIFFARTVDRLGKGVRTGARDALLSDEGTVETKGQIFGFHRSMDTFGAVLGPAVALLFLYFYPQNYKILFFLAFIPGLFGVFLTYIIKEKPKSPKENKNPGFFSFIKYLKSSPRAYKYLVSGLLLFALINSSDIFLLLKMKEAGLDDTAVIGFYIFYNLIFAVLAYPIGIAADKIGLKRIFISGLIIFSITYIGMGFSNSWLPFLICFFLYGVYAAATEGIAKAWITNIAAKEDTATAIGTYTAFQSICALIASSLTGLLWFSFGAQVAFLISGTVALAVAIYLSFINFKKVI